MSRAPLARLGSLAKRRFTALPIRPTPLRSGAKRHPRIGKGASVRAATGEKGARNGGYLIVRRPREMRGMRSISQDFRCSLSFQPQGRSACGAKTPRCTMVLRAGVCRPPQCRSCYIALIQGVRCARLATAAGRRPCGGALLSSCRSHEPATAPPSDFFAGGCLCTTARRPAGRSRRPGSERRPVARAPRCAG